MAYKNFFVTRLYTDIGASDTTITLETAPTATSGRLVLEARNATQREIIKYTGVSGNDITGVTRGQGGTTAKSHLKNALVEMNLTAEDIQDLYDAFGSFAASNGSGWLNIPQVPSVITQNGQKEVVLRYTGVDLTPTLAEGMKGRFPRTGTTPTQSMSFVSASSQYAARPTASITGLTWTDDFTCEALIYLDAYSSSVSQCIVSRYSTQGWIFRITTAGQIDIFGQAGGASKNYTSYQSVPTGRWVHVAAKMDMSGSVGATWIDGKLVPGFFTGTGVSLTQVGNDLQVGRFATSDYFNGRIANIRVWSTMRTDAEIADNYAREVPASTTGLQVHIKGNSSWNDSSTNANHLTTVSGAVNNYASHPFSATEYGIYTKVVKNGSDTDVTLYTGNSFIPSETLGTSSYSTGRAPYGFPVDVTSWRVEVPITTALGVNVGLVSDTYYNPAGLQITMPTGKWKLSYTIFDYFAKSNTSALTTRVVMGTAATTNRLPKTVTSYYVNGLATDYAFSCVLPPADMVTTSLTTLYGQISISGAAITSQAVRGDMSMSYILLECAYL
jgi:hypothetical protein